MIQYRNGVLWIAGLLMVWMVNLPFAHAAEDPVQMLEGVTTRVMQELKTHREELHQNPHRIYALVEHLILPYTDFDEMARWVVGRNAWQAASEGARKAFVQEFRTLVVNTYAKSLLNYTDQKVEFLPVRGSLERERVQINSLIRDPGRAPVRLDYRLIRLGSVWRVYDIIIEGVSLMQGYRAQFAEDVRRGGVEAVITRLRQHHHS